MKSFLFISLLLFSINSKARDFRSGDVILVPLYCYSCPIIEDETNSDYSHSGVVIKENNEIYVLESLGQVKATKLKEFLGRVRPGRKAGLFRNKELELLNNAKLNRKLISNFKKNFEGLPFDSNYLWNNFDEQGREKLYCSEFVTKFLNQFLKRKVGKSVMTYNRNRAFWKKYFAPNPIPIGKIGNNPGHFQRHSMFYKVRTNL